MKSQCACGKTLDATSYGNQCRECYEAAMFHNLHCSQNRTQGHSTKPEIFSDEVGRKNLSMIKRGGNILPDLDDDGEPVEYEDNDT